MAVHRNARRHQGGRQTSTSTLALAAIIGAATVIIALCWRPWVDFGISHLDGKDADAVTGIGDGYFVAVFAASIVVLAAALILQPGRWARLLPPIGAAAIAIALIAGYDAGTAWHVVGVDIQGPLSPAGMLRRPCMRYSPWPWQSLCWPPSWRASNTRTFETHRLAYQHGPSEGQPERNRS